MTYGRVRNFLIIGYYYYFFKGTGGGALVGVLG